MDVQKLAKVLAMAASDNDTEALHALRTAGRLLDNAGLDFVALAERLAVSNPAVSVTRMEDLEDTVFDLRNEIRHLRTENERLRQGMPAAANPAPANLADAAQGAAQAIRLQAELDETKGNLALAIETAERIALQFETLKGRTDRLEAENRRLSLAAGALKAALDERIADQDHPLPPPVQRPAAIIPPEPATPPMPRRTTPPPAAARRGKPAPVGQYALF